MVECRGSVKLFGQVITLPVEEYSSPAIGDEEEQGEHKEPLVSKTEEEVSSAMKEHIQTEAEEETTVVKYIVPNEGEEGEKKGKGTSVEKLPKKPDIILPCPRCTSMDTKFCYYNNYNVNQPRHFCRNCQRYWTAGGTMRNVPVGAGRRKSKSSSSNCRHITISEAAFCGVQLVSQEPTHNSLTFPNNGTTTAEKNNPNSGKIEAHPGEESGIPFTYFHPSKPSMTVLNSDETSNMAAYRDPGVSICTVHPMLFPCFSGSSWLYQGNHPPAPFCTSNFQVGFHPVPPFWGSVASSHPTAGSAVAGSSLPLGKHSRDEQILQQGKYSDKPDTPIADGYKEMHLRVPKTMKINNPDEVAKSSIWTTVGMKRDKAGGITHGGLFSSFHPKEDRMKTDNAKAAVILTANPAALARSLKYKESV